MLTTESLVCDMILQFIQLYGSKSIITYFIKKTSRAGGGQLPGIRSNFTGNH